MNLALGILCAIGFAAAATVHFATFGPTGLLEAAGPAWFLLHIGCIAAMAALVINMRANTATSPKTSGIMFKLVGLFPAWAVALLAATAIYAAVNFALFMSHVREGQSQFRNGHYGIYDHARFVRASSLEEFRQQQVYLARGFSGHWMLFYLGPALYFLTRRPSITNQA